VKLLKNAKHLNKEIKATRVNKNTNGKENYGSIPEFNRNNLTSGITIYITKKTSKFHISLAVPNTLFIRKCNTFCLSLITLTFYSPNSHLTEKVAYVYT
jgi:hypothetical protein